MNIKEMVAEGRKVRFLHYQLGELWYRSETGFELPVPVSDCGDGTFRAEDTAGGASLVRRGFALQVAAMLCSVFLGVPILGAAAQTPGPTDPVIEAVRERVEALTAGGRLSVDGTPLSSSKALMMVATPAFTQASNGGR